MTDRRSHDTPAAMIAVVLGVVLLVLGLPKAISNFPEAAKPDVYNVLWSEVAAGSQSVTLAEGQQQNVELRVTDVLTSRVRLVPGECTDTPNSPLVGPASLHFRLVRRTPSGEERLKEGDVTCASKDNARFTIDRINHPDIGSVEAASAEEAVAQVWGEPDRPVNETATYRLEVSATRQAGPGGPIPVNPVAPSLRAVFTVEADHWVVAVVPAEPEVTVR